MTLLAASFISASSWSVFNWLATPNKGVSFWTAWISCAIGFIVFFLIFVISGKAFSSAVLSLALAFGLWAGNKLKVKILSETLVFTDLLLAKEACSHPRLYFGYAPYYIWPIGIVVLAVIAGFFALEPAFFQSVQEQLVLGLLGFAFALAMLGLFIRANSSQLPSFNANQDASFFSPLGAACLHSVFHLKNEKAIRQTIGTKTFASEIKNRSKEGPSEQHHLLLIQAESFCDLCRDVKGKSFIPQFEHYANEYSSGYLELPWRGAYTMRTEFSVLTGISSEELKSYSFNPYLLGAKSQIESIATHARRLGYRTVVWHPNDAVFFRRDLVMKNLGFQCFKGLEDFSDLPLVGRYVSDEALLKKAGEWLISQKEKTFLFVITMEAHGPWDKGSVNDTEELTEEERYGIHLAGLDRGLADLFKKIENEQLKGVVGVYGDHLPGIERLTKERAPSITPWLLTGTRKVVHQRFNPCEFSRYLREEALA